MRRKKVIEASLVPWVIAEPSAFPELKAMPFVFAHTVPVIYLTICQQRQRLARCVVSASHVEPAFWLLAAVSMLNGSQMWEQILRAVQRRGIPEVCPSLAVSIQVKI